MAKKKDYFLNELEQWYRKHIIKVFKDESNLSMMRSWVFHSIPIAFELKDYSLEGVFYSVWKDMIRNEELVFAEYETKWSYYGDCSDIPKYQLCKVLYDTDLDLGKYDCII